MLLVCCFCDNVGDDTMGRRHWQDLEVYRVPRNPKPKDTILSYTCCDHCLQGEPDAIAFRTRRSQSGAYVLDPSTPSERSVAASTLALSRP